jgi:hypothetical protein
MAAKNTQTPDSLVIPETVPLFGTKYERIDISPDGKTPQGKLQLGKVCIVARSGNHAEDVVLPVLYNKNTGARFPSFGQTADGEYRRNIQGLGITESVEEFRAIQSLAQGFVRAAVALSFRPIEVQVKTPVETKDAAADATA